MTNIDEARKRLARYADLGDEGVNGDIAAVLDALDVAEADAEKSRKAGEQILADALRLGRERDEALAVIEQVKASDGSLEWDIPPTVKQILSAVPADVLRERDAEVWFAGYDKGNLDGYFGTSSERARSPYADLDPYREPKEQGA